MFSLQNKMIIAENCKEYRAKSYMSDLQTSYISNDCSNCINFSNNTCTKNLFNKIGKMISIN
ncbi:Hypothetical protein CKL_3818 [Clostridium kluyveri DSM 555]|uniref:Uncharacterized protein n=1 Tax=Clostridium kluyveri (strain ATCC 8527 / DSM 555 / NBRC 12016 / NCIMB 10680 / K1) TaxID=431943 RepID=A5N3V0_CLOK5|nr:Hypothetical protein CKL_3818 [Clostridium kluyveri DSM 555]